MKIIFIMEFFDPHKGGTELYAQELLSALKSSHPDLSVDVLCYNTDEAPLQEDINGIRVFRIPCFKILESQFYLPNPVHLIRTLAFLSRNKYDLVFSQVRFFDPAWWSWIYARSMGARSFFIEHGTGFVEHPLAVVRMISKVVDKTISSFSLRRYDKVVVISRATRKFVEEKLGVTGTALVYGGIDSSGFPTRKSAGDTLEVAFLGRLIWAKGPQVLLEAFAAFVKNSNFKAKLSFAGEGPLRDHLERRARELGLGERVAFLGAIGKEQVKEFLSSADVFVNPSFNEGLPRVVMEAGAAGAFVIATDVGATKEIVENGRDGLLVTAGESVGIEVALKWFADHPWEARKMGENLAKKIRERFDWKVISREFWREVLA